MEKRKTLILFGAGAVIDWNGPLTSELTSIIKEFGKNTKSDQPTLAEFIAKKLINTGKYDDSETNFETIIHVIEELIAYYSSFNLETETASINRIFFDSNFEEDIYGFYKHWKKIKAKEDSNEECNIQEYSEISKNPKELAIELVEFLKNEQKELLTVIITEINKYSHKVLNNCKELSKENKAFIKWIKQINDKGNFGMYTLNYERIFKYIIENEMPNIGIFDGFDIEHNYCENYGIRANVLKILSNDTCKVHYNLHGSIYWKFLINNDYDEHTLPLLICKKYTNFEIHSDVSFCQIEKGKTLVLSSIITGYHKVQRTLLSPYKQMSAAFDKDCHFVENIYIVGYSFNDEHINASLRTAIEYNGKLTITIIDPSLEKRKFLHEILIKLIPPTCENLQKITEQKEQIDSQTYAYLNRKFIVHQKGFYEYLTSQNE